ncbi:DUF4389 domain-containing protein [Geodermatophilus sp. SYSU D00691]
MTEHRKPYPLRMDAAEEPRASRALWLVKWLLLIPHYVVLVFLWTAFVVVSVIAFFAILFTARYPRGLFDFNVGVMRWSWRVHYYGYGALGTDRYPPFTLADVPDYPAHLDVAYPERLSRGLVLVKWWLLAIPQYVIVAVFVGGGIWLGTNTADADGIWDTSWGAGGLVGLLVFIAGVVLLFSGRYPRPLYDFVLGMDRWALRVAAYAALMTDTYPPFRMDMGGPDPGTVPAGPVPPAPTGAPAAAPAPPPASWSAGRVVALVFGVLLLFGAGGTLVGAGTLLWADQTQRDGDYLMTPDARIETDRYAVTTDSFRLEGEGLDWAVDELIGTARIEVAPVDADDELFVGVARAADAETYLDGVGHASLDDLSASATGSGSERFDTTDHTGGAPAQPPTEADIWVDSSSGSGTQAVTWRPDDGDWAVVVMRADGTAGVDAEVRAGATLPGLGWVITGLFVAGAVLLALGGLLVGLSVPKAQSRPPVQIPTPREPVTPAGQAGADTALTRDPGR